MARVRGLGLVLTGSSDLRSIVLAAALDRLGITASTVGTMHCAIFCPAVGIAPAAGETSSDPPPRYSVARANGPIKLDGRLDESAWAHADTISGFRQVDPHEGAPSRYRTVVRVLYDDVHLYIGVFAGDSAGGDGVRVQDLRRDFDASANDLFGVSIDALYDRRNAVGLQITPRGTQRDLQAIDGDALNVDWDGAWHTRTEIGDSGWTAEIAIPWVTLRYKADGGPWGINFWRVARRSNETSAWHPWPRKYNAHRMTFAGVIEGLRPPPPRTQIALRPYATMTGSRIGPAGTVTRDATPNVGGELTWSPDPATTLDLTVRTDFAQADVDRQVVNLSRFSVFFPERRQFFLESASLFAVGSTGSFTVQPFFSRSIGLAADGSPIPIQGGARLIRRDAGSAVGAMALRQDGYGGRGPGNFAVGRYSKNVGARGRIGALAAGRWDEAGSTMGSRRSGVGAVDWFTRFGETMTFSGFASITQSNDSGGDGYALYGFVGRTTSSYYAGLIEAVVSKGYQPTSGFVSLTNTILTSPAVVLYARPSWRPSWLREIRPAVITYFYNNPGTFRLEQGHVQTYVDLAFSNGALVYPYLERRFERPSTDFPLVSGVTIAAGNRDYWRYGLRSASNASAKLSAIADVSSGSFFDGRALRGDFTLRLAPSPSLALSARYQVNRFTRIGVSDTSLTTHLLAPELRASLGRRAHFTAFYQYNSDIRRGTWNARLVWEYAPLSYVYLVYNDQRTVGELAGPAPATLPNQQLAVKLVYRFTP